MSSIQVQTPPAQEPISLTLLKKHLRVTIADDDTLLPLYLQSAREGIESESGRSLVNKLYRQSHDRFPGLHEEHAFGVGYQYEAPTYSHRNHHAHRMTIKLLRCPLVNVQQIMYIGTDQLPHSLYPAPAAWLPQNEYEIGDQIVDSNGNLQMVTAVSEAEDGSASISGSTEPSPWGNSLNATTSDGDLTWACKKIPAPAGDFIVDADSEPPRLVPAYGTFWPLTLRIPNAVQIFFTAGYGNDGAAAPATLKVALMLAVGASYENREAVTVEQLRQFDWYDRLIWSQRVLDYAPTR